MIYWLKSWMKVWATQDEIPIQMLNWLGDPGPITFSQSNLRPFMYIQITPNFHSSGVMRLVFGFCACILHHSSSSGFLFSEIWCIFLHVSQRVILFLCGVGAWFVMWWWVVTKAFVSVCVCVLSQMLYHSCTVMLTFWPPFQIHTLFCLSIPFSTNALSKAELCSDAKFKGCWLASLVISL